MSHTYNRESARIRAKKTTKKKAPKKATKDQTFVVYPEGDFDEHARLYTASSEEAAAQEAFNEGLVEEDEIACVFPFTMPNEYQLSMRVKKIKNG